MNVTLLIALILLVPVCVLFFWSVALFLRGKTICSFLQLETKRSSQKSRSVPE